MVKYPIIIERDLLLNIDAWLPKHSDQKKIVIITDDQVKKYYGDALLAQMKKYNPLLLSFLPGEQSKNYQTKEFLETRMLDHGCDRHTMILALGGGVVGDVAGFVAATYMRGITYIQIPTTFLAMVDSSVGGKTGIDTVHGKNLIGAFWQPSAVIVDIHCLVTLPESHIVSGLIEALKMFMTSDRLSFDVASADLEQVLSKHSLVLKNIIERAIKIKLAIVQQDEQEQGLRAILNFGHTIGHAIEKITHYTMLHGYAVALGILVEAKIAVLLGLLSDIDYRIIQFLFLKLKISGLVLKKMDHEAIILATKIDKKNQSGQVRYVLLKEIGQIYTDEHSFIYSVADEIVRTALCHVSEG